jgi:hypothetical protein
MKVVVAFMISPRSEAPLWLLSRVGAMGASQSHTFSEIFRKIFSQAHRAWSEVTGRVSMTRTSPLGNGAVRRVARAA